MTTEIERIFIESGAVLQGHFQLTSGLHSPQYWEKFRVLQCPRYTEQLCRMIAQHFKDSGAQVVAGPTVGGIILAFEVARQLGLRGIFAEREGQGRTFRRGFHIDPGERVLVVDDVLTTGQSVREVLEAVARLEGKAVGVGVLVDRSQGNVALDAPLYSCHKVSVITYQLKECPLCRTGVPLVRPGGG